MNVYFFVSGMLCFLLGIAHSLLGEYLIFKNKRNKGNLVPTKVGTELKERHLHIIWASWHATSIFGWCIGLILIKMSFESNELDLVTTSFIIQSIIYAMFVSGLLVLFATKGKHPGWIVLLLIGILLMIGS